MTAIFISHASDDKAQALALKDLLTLIGFEEAFLDFDLETGIPLGSNWERKLYEALARCHAIILILTRNWLDSKWCFAEFAQARAMGKAIYVVLENPRGEPGEIARDIQVCDLVSDREVGLARLHQELKRALLIAQDGFAFDERVRAPYPGLNAFDEQDAAVFFGRNPEIAALLERVKSEQGRSKKALILLGPSGAGKSSLLRAGAFPRLRRERDILGKPSYLVFLMRPGGAPLRRASETLRTLDPSLTTADLESVVDPASAYRLIERLRAQAGAPQATLILALDQAEEMFAVAPEEQAPFFALLGALIARDNPARLLMSMRADHVEAAQRISGLTDALDFLPVKPMPLDRLGEVINGPAVRADIVVEPELIEAIRADAATEQALPLVAFVLRELYERYGKRSLRLELAHYHAMRLDDLSPLESAVRRRAEETLSGAGEAELSSLREAFTPGLVRLDEERGVFAKRTARLDNLPRQARPLVDRLIDARLLVERPGEDGAQVEVAHEALFRVWPKLAAWLAEDRDLLVRFQGVRRAASEWSAHGGEGAWLAHRGLRLEEAEQLAARSHFKARFEAGDRNYLAQCRARDDAEKAEAETRRLEREAEQERRVRDAERLAAAEQQTTGRTRVFLGLALLPVATLSLVALYAYAEKEFANGETQLANAAAERAQANLSRVLLGLANDKYNQFDFSSAALWALEAMKTEPAGAPESSRQALDAQSLLYDALLRNHEIMDFAGHEQLISDAAFSPDGSLIATASAEHVWIWNARDGRVVRKIEPKVDSAKNAVRSVSFTADGRQLAIVNVYGPVLKVVATGDTAWGGVSPAAWFSADGSRLVTALSDGLSVIDTAAHEGKRLPGPSGDIVAGAFSASGGVFAAGYGDGAVRVWDLGARKLVLERTGASAAFVVALNKDGSQLAAVTREGRYRLYHVGEAAPAGDGADAEKDFAGGCESMEFNPSGQNILIVLNQGAALWDLPGNVIARFPPEGQSAVHSAAFSPDGRLIATASEDKAARLWEAASGKLIAVFAGHTAPVLSVRFSADGLRLLTTSADLTARVWQVEDLMTARRFDVSGDKIKAAELSPHGDRLLVLTEGGEVDIASLGGEGKKIVLPGRFSAMAWDPTGARVAVATSEGDLGVFDLAGNSPVARWAHGSEQILCLSFRPDGRQIAAGDDGGGVTFWEQGSDGWAASGPIDAQDAGVIRLAYSPDGRRLLSVNYFGEMRLIDDDARKPMIATRVSEKTVRSALFTPDGSKILTGADDSLLKIFDAATFKLLGALPQSGAIRSIHFADQGQRVVALTRDGGVSNWSLSTLLAAGDPDIAAATGLSNAVSGAATESGGDLLLVTGAGSAVRTRAVNSVKDLLDLAARTVPRSLTEADKKSYISE